MQLKEKKRMYISKTYSDLKTNENMLVTNSWFVNLNIAVDSGQTLIQLMRALLVLRCIYENNWQYACFAIMVWRKSQLEDPSAGSAINVVSYRTILTLLYHVFLSSKSKLAYLILFVEKGLCLWTFLCHKG